MYIKKTSIKGAYSVLVTPFNSDGSLNLQGLKTNIRFQMEHQVDGIVILGTTGESPTLTHDEKQLVIKTAREATKDKVPLMVGTGSYSTQQTIENSLMAQKLGADSLLVVTPYYNRPTQEGLYLHFKAVADAIKIPLVIYNIQGRTGTNLQTETLVKLSKILNIVGVKEASGNINQMMDVIENVLPVRPDFSIMSGDDALTFSLMALGGHGVYSVASNVLPKEIKNLCDACFNKDYENGRKLHYQLLPFFKSLFIETNPIPVKAVMNLLNHAAGPCRLPLSEMHTDNLKKLKQLWFK